MAGFIANPGTRRRRDVVIARGEIDKAGLALRYGVSTKTIENWERDKVIPARKKPSTARHVRWSLADVVAWERRKK